MMWCDTIWYDSYDMMSYDPMICDVFFVIHEGMKCYEQFDMVMAWYDMKWFEVIRSAMIWYVLMFYAVKWNEMKWNEVILLLWYDDNDMIWYDLTLPGVERIILDYTNIIPVFFKWTVFSKPLRILLAWLLINKDCINPQYIGPILCTPIPQQQRFGTLLSWFGVNFTHSTQNKISIIHPLVCG